MSRRHQNGHRAAGTRHDANRFDYMVGIAFACAVFAIWYLPLNDTERVVLSQCVPGNVPGVVSNSQVDGTVVRNRQRQYLIHGEGGRERVLAECVGFQCTALYEILQNQSRGKSAHAEFCGPYLTLISFDNAPVYTAQPPVQSKIDADARSAQVKRLVSLLILAAVGLGAIGYFIKKTFQPRRRNRN